MPRTRSGKRYRSRSKSPATTRRSVRMRKGRKKLALMSHTFVERSLTEQAIGVNSAASATAVYKSFNFDEVSNHTDYKNIFEYYKINKVVATFTYQSEEDGSTATNATSASTRVGEVRPMVYFQVDHNDVDATSLNELKSQARTKRVMLSSAKPEFSISLRPAVRDELYKSSLTTEYTPKWGQWLSMENGSAVPHFGLKMYAIAEGNGLNARGKVHVSYKIYFTCKNNN